MFNLMENSVDALIGSLKSKTVWFGYLLTAIGVGDWITSHGPLIAAMVPGATPLLALVGPVVILLRVLTKQPLATK